VWLVCLASRDPLKSFYIWMRSAQVQELLALGTEQGSRTKSFAKGKGAVFKLRLFIFYRAKG